MTSTQLTSTQQMQHIAHRVQRIARFALIAAGQVIRGVGLFVLSLQIFMIIWDIPNNPTLAPLLVYLTGYGIVKLASAW